MAFNVSTAGERLPIEEQIYEYACLFISVVASR